MGGEFAPYVFYTYDAATQMDQEWLASQCNGSMQVWVASAGWVSRQLQEGQTDKSIYTRDLNHAAEAAAEEAMSEGNSDFAELFRSFGVVQLPSDSVKALGKALAQVFNSLLASVRQDIPKGVKIIDQMCQVSPLSVPPSNSSHGVYNRFALLPAHFVCCACFLLGQAACRCRCY